MMPAAAKAGRERRHRAMDAATSAGLVGMCLSVLVEIYAPVSWAPAARWFSMVALLVFIAVGQRRFGLRERFLLVLAVSVTLVAAVVVADPVALATGALDRAAFLAAFMILLSLLREAAATSEAVLGVGRYLTRQPSGRRYTAIHVGGHALGVVLNFGALSLMGPLILRGSRAAATGALTGAAGTSPAGDGAMIEKIRERRQISALDRGFSWMIAWSPTTITQAIVPAVILDADPGRMAVMGGIVAAAMFVVGWGEDRLRWRRVRIRLARQGRLPEPVAAPFPRADFAWFAGVCTVLAGLSLVIVLAAGVATVPALMLAAPVVTLCWLWAQNRSHATTGATLARYRRIAGRSIPESSPEALTLAAAGYVGLVTAGLVPTASAAAALDIAAIPPVLLYALIAAMVPIASNAAMPPILVVTFFGGILSAIPGLDADPTMIGLAFALGWALNLTASPFSASSLILARVTGIPGTTLSWRWNGVFSLAAYAVVVVALVIFSETFPGPVKPF